MGDSRNELHLFDEKFVLRTLSTIRMCPNCKTPYNYNWNNIPQVPNKNLRSYRPVLLPCNHSICENCIIENRRNLCCKQCLSPVRLPTKDSRQQSRVRYNFNSYLLGEVVNSTVLLRNLNGYQNHQKPNGKKCTECEVAVAHGRCQKCNENFCKACFEKTHSVSKVFQSHKFISIEEYEKNKNMQSLLQTKKCKYHKKHCNQFCTKCREVICLTCARDSHRHHKYITLEEENKSKLLKLRSVKEHVTQTEEALGKIHKDVKRLNNRLQEDAKQSFEEISNYFLDLHNFLQNEFYQITKNLNQQCSGTQKSVNDAFEIIENSHLKLKQMKEKVEFTLNNHPLREFYIEDFISICNEELDKLNLDINTSTLPQNLFEFKPKHTSTELFSMIRKEFKYGFNDPKLSICIQSKYESMKQSASVNELNSKDVSSNVSMNSKQSKERSTDMLKLPQPPLALNGSINEGLHFNALKKQNKCNSLTLMPAMSLEETPSSEFKGLLSFVNDPSDFYIQYPDAPQTIERISGLLSMKNKSGDLQILHLEEISNDILCAAYHADSKKFYRVRIQGQKFNKETKEIHAMLVDSGEKIKFSIDNFFTLDESIVNVPYKAKQCCLAGLKPLQNKWSSDATELLMEISNNEPIHCRMFDKNCKWKVKLYGVNANKDYFSVNECFLFNGLAIEDPGNSKSSKLQKREARKNAQFVRNTFNVGDLFSTKIGFIKNPSDFYLILFNMTSTIDEMQKRLNARYNKSKPRHVYLPMLNMGCAVLFKETYYRARVEKILDQGYVCVRLVDSGKPVKVHWRCLYELDREFFHDPEFAFHCCLDNIEPLKENNYSWTKDAIEEFTLNCKMQKLSVHLRKREHFQYEVELACKIGSQYKDIGTILVESGLALYPGQSITSMSAMERQILLNDQLENSDALPIEDERYKADEEENVDSNESSHDAVVKSLILNVLHIVSPGEFYIAPRTWLKGFREFHERLQAKMTGDKQDLSKGETNSREWIVGDYCLVEVSNARKYAEHYYAKDKMPRSSKQWFRGIIEKVERETLHYSVYLRDFGETLNNINASQLEPIPHRWKTLTNIAIRCHLANVKPKDGNDSWSQKSISIFKHAISKCSELFIATNEPISEKSLPILLWGRTTDGLRPDPLMATNPMHISINRMLVKASVATSINSDGKTFTDLKNTVSILKQSEPKFPEEEINKISQLQSSTFSTNQTNNRLPNIDAFLSEDKYSTTYGKEPPTAWITPKRIDKTIFVAQGTYVDYDAKIFLHDYLDNDWVVAITKKLTELYEYENCGTKPYTENQACVVRYHINRLFCRGIVKGYNHLTREYEVYFIDYGNTESVLIEDLRPYAPFSKLNAFASCYAIDGIAPLDDKYQTIVLDKIHVLVVMKRLSIRVCPTTMDHPVPLCSIQIEQHCDLRNYLIEENLVKRVPMVKDVREKQQLNEAKRHERKLEKAKSEDEKMNDSYLPKRKCIFSITEYMNLSAQIIKNAAVPMIPKLERPPPTINPEVTFFNDEDENEEIVELENRIIENFWMKDNKDDDDDEYDDSNNAMVYSENESNDMKEKSCNSLEKGIESELESNYNRFSPLSTSTSLIIYESLADIQFATLPNDMMQFYCKVLKVVTPTVLYITVEAPAFEELQNELQMNIDKIVDSLPTLTHCEQDQMCLARYSKDNKFQRALIHSYDKMSGDVCICFMDSMIIEHKNIHELKAFSKQLIKYPLLRLLVRLAGIKPNLMKGKSQIRNALNKLIKTKKFYARVCHAEEGVLGSNDVKLIIEGGGAYDDLQLMEIALYSDVNLSNLAYKTLIQQDLYRLT